MHECQILCQNARYKRHTKVEKAPFKADCLTSIHYLFRNKVDIMIDWIGNMPRYLSQQRTWKCLQIPVQELKSGDLLFLKHKKSSRLITHVAMVLGPDEIFHCSQDKNGALIEKISEVFSRYAQPIDVKAMLSYVDPRTSREVQENEMSSIL